MSPWTALRGRGGLSTFLRVALVVVLFGGTGLAIATWGAVEYTARPAFCVSCHIMEPYYTSWAESSHRDVTCIKCHFEPGAVETGLGKFKALSQLAKYVTRTEGTKPWAEVSDASCMRSGCHSVRMLEGDVRFGRVAFDHRPHLLESRRGRRLRCVTCHSQVVQGQHVAVTESVCFTCHFMPDAEGHDPERTGDCLLCHGPPDQPVDVAGRPFEHREYVDRGVACAECHGDVVAGRGVVRQERCHSCHGEEGHLERIAETEFLHEMHVTDHKVECFECHDPIRHGLLPREEHAVVEGQGCATCHTSPHDAPRLLYAGRGAVGVDDAPSRMFETRVACEACHTGRAGFAPVGGNDGGAHARLASAASRATPAHGSAFDPRGPAAATAADVDCLHCHGTSYDGVLARWQAAVGDALERVGAAREEVLLRLEGAGDEPARLYAEAVHNLELVRMDGSRGAHNPGYALDALAAAAARLQEAARLAGAPEDAPRAALPFRSAAGCSECHVGIEWPRGARAPAFPHRQHLATGSLDCTDCHDGARHGQAGHGHTLVTREDCTSCHHGGRDERDASDCASCHRAQASLLEGIAEGLAPLPGPMADMDCGECHGEAPDVFLPAPDMCALCHEDGYDQMMLDWRSGTDELAARVEAALAEAGARGASAEDLAAARADLAAVRADGSGGSHNFELTTALLERALERLAAQ